MTGAVLDRPGTQQFELDGGLTLEELLNATLDEARTHGSTECPICHARMTYTRARESDVATRARESDVAREGGAAREPLVAECGGCGSRLS